MKNLLIVVGIAVLLVIGGGLTAQLRSVGPDGSLIPFFLVQSDSPEASTLEAAPWQAEQLVIFIGFIVFNLIGIAATIALVMWFLHRGVKVAEATENTTAITSTGSTTAVEKS